MSQPSKPSIADILPLLTAYYARPEPPPWGGSYGMGGIFHCIIEDGNYESRFAERALQQAREHADADEIRIAEMLVAMSSTQRKTLHTGPYSFYPD